MCNQPLRLCHARDRSPRDRPGAIRFFVQETAGITCWTRLTVTGRKRRLSEHDSGCCDGCDAARAARSRLRRIRECRVFYTADATAGCLSAKGANVDPEERGEQEGTLVQELAQEVETLGVAGQADGKDRRAPFRFVATLQPCKRDRRVPELGGDADRVTELGVQVERPTRERQRRFELAPETVDLGSVPRSTATAWREPISSATARRLVPRRVRRSGRQFPVQAGRGRCRHSIVPRTLPTAMPRVPRPFERAECQVVLAARPVGQADLVATDADPHASAR